MTNYDVAVVGGSFAGLSAAVPLARSLRSVLVVDAGQPRNAPAEGAHNVLGHEGIAPRELLAAGRREAEGYGVEICEGEVATVRREGDGFVLTLSDGSTATARRLLLATGLVDELPDVPGLAEHWGTSVLHCPFCHGWEVRGNRIGVLATDAAAVHQALMFRQLSPHVTVLQHTVADFEAEDWEKLAAVGVEVVSGEVLRVVGEDGALRAVELAGGHAVGLDALVVAPRFVARGELYEQLGGTLTEGPRGPFIEAGPMGRTALPGVWVAGNAGNLMASVVPAMSEGMYAGSAIHGDLLMADVERAVRERAAA
ncbi:NAD(P)/FAD-dependent oxidoreductase [Desertihabitans brevis]|uniref:NAD(P)/FAD-dependent oxidoreductase n=1 Tax=Desertihabitans brevis TaxID=2268447 RepID=A0A367YYA6_9ACTN|nr:NAD(P)/FAD-dependent oxidoreductase [Desertihabitans brevis]RCK70808.1 NAD(P)/FAD-dependent oxidoreductase [Desertihabitans brevis]